VNDADYKPPFAFTGKLNKVTLTLDRPKLTPEDVKKLQEGVKNKSMRD
jgi:arylsulfatase